ncbi:hypothetical protein DYB32_007840 [Aphanomyces invadans]|uniref:Uncharacterized protein n=1 Tax=Aphanomyces invadans TaxID=157072 RepID=A0A3R7CWA6_9STRA|nr:hypothetical protein DYB32_007840 [Aphanomyces invadans]
MDLYGRPPRTMTPASLSSKVINRERARCCHCYSARPNANVISSTYQSNLQKIANFNTVEDFWRHYIHVKRPSQLAKDTNLYLFRDQPNCAPMWEAFPNGGCWILKIKKKANVLGKMWQDLLFAVIGEAFETLNVVGIAMALRSKEDMISVWNADNSDDNIRFAIGYAARSLSNVLSGVHDCVRREKLKEILMLDSNTLIEYKFHANSIRDMSTFRNAKPYVFAASPSP